jgi:Holliday junction resolvase RusA-like endonuclease
MIFIEVDGEPISWNRPGIIRTKTKTVVYDTQKDLKKKIQWQMRSQYREEPLTVPIIVDLTFKMPIPKQTSAKMRRLMLMGMYHHYKRPDIDNLQKFYLDCMNELVFADDAQISEIRARKVYANIPGTLIRIRPISANVPPEDPSPDQTQTETELEEEKASEYASDQRDSGRGDLFGDCPEQEGPEIAGRKESCIIPFGDEQPDYKPGN